MLSARTVYNLFPMVKQKVNENSNKKVEAQEDKTRLFWGWGVVYHRGGHTFSYAPNITFVNCCGRDIVIYP